MPNLLHQQILIEGAEAWNRWRQQNPSLRPDLSHAQFHSGLELDGADLRNADLSSAQLPGVRLQDANLEDADLACANLQGAKLAGTNLRGVELALANCQHADLGDADLSGANLFATDFSNANLTDAKGAMFDETRVLYARFSPRPSDKWSILRRVYTGPNMILTLIAMFLFFAPLVATGVVLSTLSKTQNQLIHALSQIDGIKVANQCDQSKSGSIVLSVQNATINIPCRSMPMWKLLLGFDGPYGILMPILTAVLMFYQLTRYCLTHQISLMRDAEQRSGVSPPLKGRLAYPQLYKIHKVLNIILWFSVTAFILRAAEFLFYTQVILNIAQY